ncbi:DUF2780 domain-containing protein [Steroidobacter flavus]|uniref:DUF2780 domain-containing protein n=1 Tax=Steroidobacter flavus TaxID=1842136 RepID=A0ABV8T219_9GAMM
MTIRHARSTSLVTLVSLFACLLALEFVQAATPGQNAVTYLQSQFGLNDAQARGALGALLVYAREQLPKPDFDLLATRIPNADQIMQAVKLQGVVTRPLDTISDYEESLASLGIGQPLASQIAPAVIQYLGAAGFDHERDILMGILR